MRKLCPKKDEHGKKETALEKCRRGHAQNY